jgi:2-polyprenyl-6-methoxyphenol hydroxylase-like FAD-dependent oxidoreductase
MAAKLIIAGGGIGGLAAALALRRSGIEASVYERAPSFAELGAGMSLWPNATRVLKAWGILDPLAEAGEPVEQFDLLRPDGRMISSIPMGGYPTPALCIHRADLHRVLRASLGDAPLESGRRLVGFAENGKASVVARFADGHEAEADGIVGADGINSVVRAQLHGASPPVYRGYRIWRGISPDIRGTVLGHISETWGRGRRFGIMPMGQGRICWYATRNSPADQPDEAEGRKREIRDLFAGWHKPVEALIESTDAANIITTHACDRRALRRWGKGRTTLLGDAAHPITPNVGQGACLAIEDAACLAKALLQEPDVAKGFRAYEAMRQIRTSLIGWQARHIGTLGQLENRWFAGARDLITRLVLDHSHGIRLNSVYAYET